MKSWILVRGTFFVAMIAILASVAPCLADPVPGQSLEDALIDDLRSGRKSPASPRRAEGEGRPGESSFAPARISGRSVWADELGMAGVSGDTLPLVSVAERMRDVQGLLGRGECGAAAQDAQRQILDSLDQLLQQAGQSCGGACASKPGGSQPSGAAKAGNGPQPGTKQGTTSNQTSQPATGADRASQDGSPRIDPAQTRALMKRLWGELPPRRRQQMLQIPVEEFLPRYEAMIEDYFRRLSEEKQTRHGAPK